MEAGTTSRRCVAFADELLRHADRVALVEGEREVSYRELAETCDRIAAQLGPVRRLVLLLAAPTVPSVASYLAALRSGHPVLVAGTHGDAHTQTLIERYDPDVIIGARTNWRPVERRPGTRHELHEDLAALMPTSGSTGSAKLVRLSHANLQANAEAITGYLDIRPDDRAMLSLPLSYCYGLSVLHTHLLRGASVVLTSRSVIEPQFWDDFRRVAATTFPAVPYTFELLDRIGFAEQALPSLRYVTQAGGRLAPEAVRRYARLGRTRGWRLVVMYGQTEATARMAYLPAEFAEACPEAIGRPVPGGEFFVEPCAGAPAGCGELVYRGANVMLGYARSAADLALGRTVEQLRTGDLARRRPDGLYELAGRRSRFVKIFSRRIDLDELERRLAAAGVPALCAGDDRGLTLAFGCGVEQAAAVRLAAEHSGLPTARIGSRCYADLPRLANGKPDYHRVREEVRAAAPAGEVGRPPVSAIYASVLGKVARDEDTFVSLGGDSLSYVELATRLEARLGHLPPDWPLTPIGVLAGTARRPPRRLAQIETNIVLRAAGIVLIVAAHLDLWGLRGGGHILLAVAGYGFARFQLAAVRSSGSVRPMLASVLRIAAPSMLFICALVLLADGYGVANIFLLNHYLGPPSWDQRWNYWFIEALVEILLVLSVLFAVPALRRLEARRGFGVALGFVLLGLAVRFDLLDLGAMKLEMSRPHSSFWIFALGWLAQRASSRRERVLVSAIVLLSLPGTFPDDHLREAVIATGLLALTWIASLRLPRVLARGCAIVAAASLYIYLTHWLVYPWLLQRGLAPVLAGLAAVGFGVLVQVAKRRVGRSRPARLPLPA